MPENMIHTNMRLCSSKLMLHTEMCNFRTYVTHEYEMFSVRTYVTYGNSINVFYCINKFKQWGWATGSTNISYGPLPTNVYINVMQTHDNGKIMLLLLYNNINI